MLLRLASHYTTVCFPIVLQNSFTAFFKLCAEVWEWVAVEIIWYVLHLRVAESRYRLVCGCGSRFKISFNAYRLAPKSPTLCLHENVVCMPLPPPSPPKGRLRFNYALVCILPHVMPVYMSACTSDAQLQCRQYKMLSWILPSYFHGTGVK